MTDPTHAAVTADRRRTPARRMIEHVMIEHARSSADIAELREMYRQTDQIRAAILDRVNELAAEAEADVRLATPGELISHLIADPTDKEAAEALAELSLHGCTAADVFYVLDLPTVEAARSHYAALRRRDVGQPLLDLCAAKGRALKGDA